MPHTIGSSNHIFLWNISSRVPRGRFLNDLPERVCLMALHLSLCYVEVLGLDENN